MTFLCYRATVDGFQAENFHTKCNNKGPTITIVKSGSRVFGGYTSTSWKSIANYVQDATTYLFSVNNEAKYPNIAGNGNSIYDNNGYGPTFGGGHDLHISTNSN